MCHLDQHRIFRAVADFFEHAFRNQQERPCTYHVTLRRVRASIVAVEKQSMLHIPRVCVCSLRYPACNARAPFCHLWLAPLYQNFLHYLIKDMSFVKEVLQRKIVVAERFGYICFLGLLASVTDGS